MRLLVPLAILAVAVAVLMLTPADSRIAGLDHQRLAASAGLAALLANPERFRGKRVGLILSGGNIDLEKFCYAVC